MNEFSNFVDTQMSGASPRRMAGTSPQRMEAQTGSGAQPNEFTNFVEQNKEPLETVPKSSSVLANTIAGVLSGNVEGGLSSWETLATSYVDLGRIFSSDPEGNFHLWQSTPSMMGISQEHWDTMAPSERRLLYTTYKMDKLRKELSPDEKAAMYAAGKLGGWIFTDPLSYIPVLGQTTKARAGIGAATGAVSAAGYSAVTEGEVDATQVVTGALLAGGAVAGLDKLAKGLAKKSSTKRLDKLTEIAAEFRAESRDKIAALEKAKRALGYSDEDIAKLLNKSGRVISDIHETLQTKKGAVSFLKERSAARAAKESTLIGRTTKKVSDTVSEFVQPVSIQIRAISPRIHHKLNRMFSDNMNQVSDALTKTHAYNAMLADGWKNPAFKKAYGAGDVQEMHRILKAKFGSDKVDEAYKSYTQVMDNLYKGAKDIGREIDYIKDYHPYKVKDYNKLMSTMSQKELGDIDILLKKEAQRLHGKNASADSLSQEAREKIIDRYITPRIKGVAKSTPGSAKARTIQVRNEAMLEAYATPSDAIIDRIMRGTEDINKAKVFGKHGKMSKGGVIGELTDQDNKSIASMVAEEFRRGSMTADQMKKLQGLLEDVFIHSKRTPQWWSKLGRNATYLSTIANPRSALTQFGDIAIAGTVNGWDNLALALRNKMRGKGLSASQWGFAKHISEELMEKGTADKWMHRAYKAGGFTQIDTLGKTAVINSALVKYQRLAATKAGRDKLFREFGRALTAQEFNQLVKDLPKAVSHDTATDLVRSVLFANLADIQPVSIMEMPKWYINHPNGRMIYSLRTFTIKYLNLLHQSLMKDFSEGRITSGLTKAFALYMTHVAAGSSTDVIKKAIIDREPEEAAKLDEIVADNLITATGVFDRYTDPRNASSPLSSLSSKLFPFTSVFDPLAQVAIKLSRGQDISDDLEEKVWRRIPLIGPLIEPWFKDTIDAITFDKERDV